MFFSMSPVPSAITSLDDGTILRCNDAFLGILGYSANEVSKISSSPLALWAEPEELKTTTARLLEGKNVRNTPVSFKNTSGNIVKCLLSANKFSSKDKDYALYIVSDLSELEAKNAELENFTYTVSHDLKSPLVTIGGFAGLLQDKIALGDMAGSDKDLARIKRSVEKMFDLLEDLLTLSRAGRFLNTPEDLCLEETIREAISLLAGRFEGKDPYDTITLITPLPSVRYDKQRLVQILQNLIDNAIKFSGEGKDARIEIGTLLENNDLLVYVRDNGIGIKHEHQEKIFDIFFQLDPKREGTGLGLALIRRILSVHKGRLGVSSEGPGKGSTFSFTIPLSNADSTNLEHNG